MSKNHGPSIKDDDTYEALRDDGYSKEKAARIANAQASDEMSTPLSFCRLRAETAVTSRDRPQRSFRTAACSCKSRTVAAPTVPKPAIAILSGALKMPPPASWPVDPVGLI